ncbi:hypothetical protein RRG08_038802 [Elysia crispata]|uniref:Uncharacterized protein n=1 Tax=Elysia crispata TaxID=231223 RepID=A0AAE0YSP8_9GAST|nr:hypothetical protein RRG08_038802 [Elysia crispata]
MTLYSKIKTYIWDTSQFQSRNMTLYSKIKSYIWDTSQFQSRNITLYSKIKTYIWDTSQFQSRNMTLYSKIKSYIWDTSQFQFRNMTLYSKIKTCIWDTSQFQSRNMTLYSKIKSYIWDTSQFQSRNMTLYSKIKTCIWDTSRFQSRNMTLYRRTALPQHLHRLNAAPVTDILSSEAFFYMDLRLTCVMVRLTWTFNLWEISSVRSGPRYWHVDMRWGDVIIVKEIPNSVCRGDQPNAITPHPHPRSPSLCPLNHPFCNIQILSVAFVDDYTHTQRRGSGTKAPLGRPSWSRSLQTWEPGRLLTNIHSGWTKSGELGLFFGNAAQDGPISKRGQQAGGAFFLGRFERKSIRFRVPVYMEEQNW